MLVVSFCRLQGEKPLVGLGIASSDLAVSRADNSSMIVFWLCTHVCLLFAREGKQGFVLVFDPNLWVRSCLRTVCALCTAKATQEHNGTIILICFLCIIGWQKSVCR